MRVSAYLASTFPGIWRDTARLRPVLAGFRPSLNSLTGKARMMEALYRYVMTGKSTSGDDFIRSIFDRALAVLAPPWSTAEESASKATIIYGLLDEIGGLYAPVEPVPYLGRLHPAEAMNVRIKRRQEIKENFIKALAAILLTGSQPAEQEDGKDKTGVLIPELSGDTALALLLSQQKDKEDGRNKTEAKTPSRFLTVGSLDIEIPEQLRMLGDHILDDLGYIPNEYIAAAQGMAGRAAPTTKAASTPAGESFAAPLTYDEWDFRRAGFRKDWCILRQRRILPVKGTFVANTLEKYRGLLMQLKKQFEMLRCQERFVKRQRDGDDIDLDAVIESISDTKAGRAPSERLFVKLLRDERNIAVLFLVDMSSSTEGWVSQALKEALILMGEALEVLGDRYAVYGFSGMRRLRTDFYHIKDFDEPYNDEIKGRIAAIAPKEYTRMGPPLRHAANILREVEAKVRLLVILSDGKPEDYDDYKGEYAIEDTRHALIEAKTAGIHPFCITIDHHAHDYIAHMYGEVNYIFVDDVRKLPARMPEIYRTLTT